MALLADLKQANLWIYITLKDYPSSLKDLENVHSSWKNGHIKLTSSSITSWCYSWKLLLLDFAICFLFKRCFELVHRKDVPLLLWGLSPTIMCSFSICKLLYDLNLILFQQLILIVQLVTTQIQWLAITMHCEWS